jgi:hypothetical protein
VEFLVIRSSDDNVIHEPEQVTWIFALERCKDVIHKLLESSWGIGQPERHDIGLKKPKWCLESGLPPVFRLDPDVVIPISYVESGHQYCSM